MIKLLCEQRIRVFDWGGGRIKFETKLKTLQNFSIVKALQNTHFGPSPNCELRS